MYDEHFGLKETPFTIAPDPRFLYMSERHREALAHLVYGFETDGGFVLLTGEVGTGKTTISRCLLEQLPQKANVAFVLNPKLSAQELLATICDELHINYPPGNTSLKKFIDLINVKLLETNAQGRKTVVIIEESQNLEQDVLEQLRLLTNLETNQRKLMQIILIGQPELLDLLARPELRQLEQRITARYHLLPLSAKDTADYVRHRLGVAGVKEPIFGTSLLRKIYKYTDGVPRKINLLCDRAMLGAYVQNQKTIDNKILDRAAKEVFGEKSSSQSRRYRKSLGWAAAAIALVLGGVGLSAAYYTHDQKNKSETPLVSRSVTEPKPASGKNSHAQTQPVVAVAVDIDGSLEKISQESLDYLDAQPLAESVDQAFVSLFNAWNQAYLPEKHGSACDYAASIGLGCLQKSGDLASLQNLNRPAILRLLTRRGKPTFVTLLSIADSSATVVVGKEHKIFRKVDLESRWFGDYTLLWKLPPAYSGVLAPGKSGDSVKWLSQQLNAVLGIGGEAVGSVYNDALVAQVREFQQAREISSDGIAGTTTIIHINTLTDATVPKLSQEPDVVMAESFKPVRQSTVKQLISKVLDFLGMGDS